MSMKAIKINEADNVAVALKPLLKGEAVKIGGQERADQEVLLLEDIAQGHKFALEDIDAGSDVIKYGAPVGAVSEDVKRGGWIHVHNLKTNLGEVLEYQYSPSPLPQNKAFSQGAQRTQNQEKTEPVEATFQGYARKNGKAGIRNEIWVIPTVGCVNSVAERLAKEVSGYGEGKVDGVHAFPHPYGCSQMGEDQMNTLKALSALINHPNAGGVLVLGLGCENCNFAVLKEVLKEYDEDRVAFLECQQAEDEIQAGTEILQGLIDKASAERRQEIPVSQLVIGLKCGGSDGLSGITANPLVGSFSDRLIRQGGTTILTEVPEMFGAETLLMNRCRSKQVFDKLVTLINDFKDYFTRHGQVIYENPSPGNKAGGISTLEDKSLGCTQKGGSAQVVDVIQYAEPVKEKGLNISSAPGNDLVAATALALAGAHIVLFTTGRGTPFGSPVPTVKISTNSRLAEKKAGWIDFNAGSLVEGKAMEELTDEFFRFILEVASGRQTKTELDGYRDLAIFKSGVTL